MLRLIALAMLSLAFPVAVGAQTTRATVRVKSDDGRVLYATYAARPVYPYELRAKHIEGAGVFQLHIRADGTVSSVDTLRSTGNALFDQSARSAYLRWRFRAPGSATIVKIPITFAMAH
jgi:TonB family protein